MASRKQVAENVYNSVEGVTKKQAEDAVDCVFNCISDYLADGDRVQIPGFGSFNVSERSAREGVNPATGERIHIAASKNVRFKAGKDLKERVNR